VSPITPFMLNRSQNCILPEKAGFVGNRPTGSDRI
jgi:hypothetical protein